MEYRLERSEAHLLAADRWYPPEGPWQFVVEAVVGHHRPGPSNECLCGARLPGPTIQDMKRVDEYEVQRLLDRV